MKKTGKRIATLLIFVTAVAAPLVFAPFGFADEARFTASVDQNEIGRDDSVALHLTVESDGGSTVGNPSYDAPDFEEINSYNSSFVQSTYDSSVGKIQTRNNQSLTVVLHPKKEGQLRISHLKITIDGQIKTAPDITIAVTGAGAGTAPPRRYGGSGMGLRGAMKQPNGNAVFTRAEVDKEQVYKGEQVIVSYYLYRRVRISTPMVDQLPILNGFLREELEMPAMTNHWPVETVVLDGVAYQRSLLARYAAYPLQEGKLPLDSIRVKYNYFPGVSDDGEDPIQQFFRQMTPREGVAKSDPISIQVMPLPADGRPPSFTGAVGDFTVSSAIDKTEVRANEPVSLTVKIEGRGNVAAIGEPKVQWPNGIELYDSKGNAKTGKGGVGEKDFEILLIPRIPGKVTLPAMEFSFFDPVKKQYNLRSTQPIDITVNEAAAGSAPPPATTSSSGAISPSAGDTASPAQTLRPWKDPASRSEDWGPIPPWRWMYMLSLFVFGLFAAWVGLDALRAGWKRWREIANSRASTSAKSWDRLRSNAKAAKKMDWPEVLKSYDLVVENALAAIERLYQIPAKSLAKVEIGRILVDDHGVDPEKWKPIAQLIDFNEAIRFAGTSSSALDSEARQALISWVDRIEKAVTALENSTSR